MSNGDLVKCYRCWDTGCPECEQTQTKGDGVKFLGRAMAAPLLPTISNMGLIVDYIQKMDERLKLLEAHYEKTTPPDEE